MSHSRIFIDTNILLYAEDERESSKQSVAQAIISEALTANYGVVSTQVLQEYFVIATRKLKVDATMARRKVGLFAKMHVVQVDIKLILEAIDQLRLSSLSFWDALIVRAAAAANCATLCTEDLNHTEVIAGVRITNPFS